MPYNIEMVCILFCMYWEHTGYAISVLQIFLCQKWQQNVFLLNCVIVQFVYTVLYLGRIRYMYVTYHIVSCIFERLQHPLSGLVKLMHARPMCSLELAHNSTHLSTVMYL